jgi:hypothetical protein
MRDVDSRAALVRQSYGGFRKQVQFRQDKSGGASRDRTDDLIVANDNVTGSALLLIQTLTTECASNRDKLLGRKWDVRGDVGVCLASSYRSS